MSRDRRRRLPREINLVPFMDVLLVLLVVLMVGAPIAVQGIDIRLPSTASTDLPVSQGEIVVISITAQGDWVLERAPGQKYGDTLEGQALLRGRESHESLLLYLHNLKARVSNPQIMVRADEKAPYGAFARLMAELQSQGFDNLGLVTVPSGSSTG